MNHILASLAEHFQNPGMLIPILVPLIVFTFIGVIVWSGLYFQNQKQKLWHETARIALEKGQPLPEMPNDEAPGKMNSPAGQKRNELRSALILIAVGAGLYLGLPQISSGIPLIGAYITGFIGIAMLISALLNRASDTKKSD